MDTSLSEAMANCHSGVRPVRHLYSESSVESAERVREQEGPGLTIGLSRPRKLAKYVLLVISFASCVKDLRVQAKRSRKN